jgi:hypothetical protein
LKRVMKKHVTVQMVVEPSALDASTVDAQAEEEVLHVAAEESMLCSVAVPMLSDEAAASCGTPADEAAATVISEMSMVLRAGSSRARPLPRGFVSNCAMSLGGLEPRALMFGSLPN